MSPSMDHPEIKHDVAAVLVCKDERGQRNEHIRELAAHHHHHHPQVQNMKQDTTNYVPQKKKIAPKGFRHTFNMTTKKNDLNGTQRQLRMAKTVGLEAPNTTNTNREAAWAESPLAVHVLHVNGEARGALLDAPTPGCSPSKLRCAGQPPTHLPLVQQFLIHGNTQKKCVPMTHSVLGYVTPPPPPQGSIAL